MNSTIIKYNIIVSVAEMLLICGEDPIVISMQTKQLQMLFWP